MMHDVGTLYNAILDGLQVEAENEKKNDSAEIDIIQIIITISLVIHILSSIAIVGFCVKYEKQIDKVKALVTYKQK